MAEDRLGTLAAGVSARGAGTEALPGVSTGTSVDALGTPETPEEDRVEGTATSSEATKGVAADES